MPPDTEATAPEASPAAQTEALCAQHTHRELQSLCRDCGLPVKGSKHLLAQRIYIERDTRADTINRGA